MNDRFTCPACSGSGNDNDEYYSTYTDPKYSKSGRLIRGGGQFTRMAPCSRCRGTGLNLCEVVSVLETLSKNV